LRIRTYKNRWKNTGKKIKILAKNQEQKNVKITEKNQTSDKTRFTKKIYIYAKKESQNFQKIK